MTRRRPWSVQCLLAFACCVGAPHQAGADGGHVCASGVAGGFRITLFSQPTPVRVGDAEITVLVQDATSGELRPEIDVMLRVLTGGGASPVAEVATRRGVAENRLLRGATLSFATPGEVVLEGAVVGDSADRVRCSLAVEAAAPPLLAYWPLLALPPVAAALFATNQILARRQEARRRGTRRAPRTPSSHDA